MAGSKPGPAKGSGGRPRKPENKLRGRKGDGYVRVTIGPPGKGKQVYLHRKKAGVVNAGEDVTVDHKDVNPKNNRRSNLEVVSRVENVKRENKRRAARRKRG